MEGGGFLACILYSFSCSTSWLCLYIDDFVYMTNAILIEDELNTRVKLCWKLARDCDLGSTRDIDRLNFTNQEFPHLMHIK